MRARKPLVGLAALLATGCVAHAPPRGAGVRVEIELFLVTLGPGDSVRYIRKTAPLGGGANPDDIVRALRRPNPADAFAIPTPTLVHSTSWRWEPHGGLVLTYLAFGDEVRPGAGEPHELRRDELVGSGPTRPLRPRPDVIREVHVLTHALRHIALLLSRPGEDALRARFAPRSLAFFRGLQPEPAGMLRR
jgi:hypothetical protein